MARAAAAREYVAGCPPSVASLEPAPCCSAENVGGDTRSSHFTLGDDAVDWATANATTFGAPGVVERAKSLKPSGGGGIMFGNDAVEYKSAAGAAYSGGSVPPKAPTPKSSASDLKGAWTELHAATPRRAERVCGCASRSAVAAERHARHFVLGDDTPEYESVTMRQARDIADAKPTEARVADRKRGHGPASFTFGYEAPQYATTTSSSMVDYGSKGAERAPRPVQPAFVFGDDSVDYVSNRMAEEGIMARKIGQRYVPNAGNAAAVLARSDSGGARKDTTALAGVSWKLGSDAWEPTSSASADYKWPEGVTATVLAKPLAPVSSGVVRSNVHMGDDGARFTTEARGQYAAPDPASGGRQASFKPNSGKIEFGSDKVDYASAYSATFAGKAGDASSMLARTAAKERTFVLRVSSCVLVWCVSPTGVPFHSVCGGVRVVCMPAVGQKRNIVFGDDDVAWESSAQGAAQGFRPPSGEAYARACVCGDARCCTAPPPITRLAHVTTQARSV